MSYNISLPFKLADELINQLINETDNAADMLAGISLATRRLQGYKEFMLLSANPTLRGIDTKNMRRND